MHREMGIVPEEQWEEVALRWTLGLGAIVGAWWMLFGMMTLQAVLASRWGLAVTTLILGMLPNLLWSTAKREDRVAGLLGFVRAVWQLCRNRRLAGPV